VAATGEDNKASISEPALNEREGTILMGLQRTRSKIDFDLEGEDEKSEDKDSN
jgi:hypothetical protein